MPNDLHAPLLQKEIKDILRIAELLGVPAETIASSRYEIILHAICEKCQTGADLTGTGIPGTGNCTREVVDQAGEAKIEYCPIVCYRSYLIMGFYRFDQAVDPICPTTPKKGEN